MYKCSACGYTIDEKGISVSFGVHHMTKNPEDKEKIRVVPKNTPGFKVLCAKDGFEMKPLIIHVIKK